MLISLLIQTSDEQSIYLGYYYYGVVWRERPATRDRVGLWQVLWPHFFQWIRMNPRLLVRMNQNMWLHTSLHLAGWPSGCAWMERSSESFGIPVLESNQSRNRPADSTCVVLNCSFDWYSSMAVGLSMFRQVQTSAYWEALDRRKPNVGRTVAYLLSLEHYYHPHHPFYHEAPVDCY